jgi:transcriptional regulator with XRE-family HTH domain
MQAEFSPQHTPSENQAYDFRMPRTHKKTRPAQAVRLVELRKAVGLTQVELAALIGETQQNVAFWEQSQKPPRSDVLSKMAKALGTTVEHILGISPIAERRPGPVGKAQKLFEEVSRLPRSQQDKILEFVSAYVDQYKRKAS